MVTAPFDRDHSRSAHLELFPNAGVEGFGSDEARIKAAGRQIV